MKKLFFIFVGICLTFLSCESKDLFSSQADFEGTWVCIDNNEYYGTCYEISGNVLTYTRYEGGYIDSQNYYVPNSIASDFANGITLQYEFDEQSQTIYILSGVKAGVITRIEKDKAIFKKDYWLLVDGTFQRVKGIKL